MTAPTAPNPRRRTALLAAFTLILTAGALAPKAGAQKSESSTTPYAEFQNSTLTGTTNTINVSNVPLVSSTGAITYDNVTITFKVSSTGVLSVSSTKVVAAPEVQTDGFEAGNYVGPSTLSNYLITVNGPGVGPGGTTEWSLLASSGASSYTSPSQATWYVGPLDSNNPMYPRLQKVGITSTAYSYGTGSGVSCYYGWCADSLLGFAQTGSGLTIVNFTDGSGNDHNTPQTSITYELIQP